MYLTGAIRMKKALFITYLELHPLASLLVIPCKYQGEQSQVFIPWI